MLQTHANPATRSKIRSLLDPGLLDLPWLETVRAWEKLRTTMTRSLGSAASGLDAATLLTRLRDLAAELGLPARLAQGLEPEEAALVTNQWAAFLALCDDVSAATEVAAPSSPLTDPVTELQQLLAAATVPSSAGRRLRPEILTPGDLRGLSCTGVWLLDVTEGVFPERYPYDWLLGEATRARFIRAGIPLEDADEKRRRERLLFDLTCAAANRCLVLSRATREKGVPLLPSYLTREVALSQTGPSEPEHLAGFDRGTRIDRAALQRRIRAERERRGSGFDAWQGLLEGGEAVRFLTWRHDGGKELSPTALSDFRRCPFAFLVVHEWRLQPAPEPRDLLGPAEEGAIAHDVLAALFRHRLGEPLSRQSLADLIQQAEGQIAARVAAWGEVHLASTAAMQAASTAVRRLVVRTLAAEHRRAESGYALLPTWVEEERQVRLGDSLVLPCRIDRIDEGLAAARPGDEHDGVGDGDSPSDDEASRVAGGDSDERVPVVAVYDYKRSAQASKDVLELVDLQLPLYALAVKQSERQAQLLGAGWFVMSSGDWRYGLWRAEAKDHALLGSVRKGVLSDEAFAALLTAAENTAVSSAEQIVAGHFPVLPHEGECPPFCPAASVCRVDRARLGGKRDWAVAHLGAYFAPLPTDGLSAVTDGSDGGGA